MNRPPGSSSPARRGWQAVLPGESRVERAFAEWIETEAGRWVERDVIRLARDLLRRGCRHYGIAALIEVIRYHAPVPREEGNPYKIDNSFRSLLARKVMDEQADLRGFFTIKPLRGRA